MEINKPYLFIEINDKNFIFLVVKYNEDFECETLDSYETKSKGVLDGKIIDIKIVSEIIKEHLKLIETKNKVTFKNAVVINDQNNFDCINVSGYKNLGGSQILEEDISFLLNNIKKIIIDNEKKKTLIHLFNSKFILDGKVIDNLPIGVYGNYFNQHLTFFLFPENDYKNLKLALNKSGINIERVIFKPFVTGINIINKEKNLKKFMILNIKKESSNVSLFEDKSFVFNQSFNFGSNILIKDVSKLCSIDFEKVEKIIKDIKFSGELNDKYLDKKYFEDLTFRKISLKHINEIINARLEEIINITIKKNINFRYLNNFDNPIIVLFEDLNIFINLEDNIVNLLKKKQLTFFHKTTQDEHLVACKCSAELLAKGWVKEAIPIIQTKKSMISRFFSSLFE